MRLVDRRAALVFAGAVALLAGGYYAFRPTDESRIRSQLDKLAAALRITDADLQTNPIGRLAHVSGIFETLFEPDVRASVPDLPSLGSGRRGLEELVTGAPRFVRSVDVDFSSVTVKLDEAATSAAVGATAHVVAHDRDGRAHDERRAVDFRFVKQDGIDGSWVIATATVWSKEDARPE